MMDVWLIWELLDTPEQLRHLLRLRWRLLVLAA